MIRLAMKHQFLSKNTEYERYDINFSITKGNNFQFQTQKFDNDDIQIPFELCQSNDNDIFTHINIHIYKVFTSNPR